MSTQLQRIAEVAKKPTRPNLRARSANGLPTQDDLPHTDNELMESQKHYYQMGLLLEPLQEGEAFQNWYVNGDMMIHFTLDDEVKRVQKKFRGPDIFVVKNTTRELRKSWVVWQERKSPNVIIELLSASTARIDKRVKKDLYQDHLKTPEYFLYDIYRKQTEGYRLEKGVYEPIPHNERGWLISQELGLALVFWTGQYKKVPNTWLRWATVEGEVLQTSSERAEPQELRAEQQELRAERLAAMLRNLGIDPDQQNS